MAQAIHKIGSSQAEFSAWVETLAVSLVRDFLQQFFVQTTPMHIDEHFYGPSQQLNLRHICKYLG